LLLAAIAHAHAHDVQADPLVDRIVAQLEASPSGCTGVAPDQPARLTIERDIAYFTKSVGRREGVHFEVMDCTVDGFVYKGRTIVVSTRLTRLPLPQRFFIFAHEMGHIALHHHAVVSSFVARAVSSTAGEAAARAAVASGLGAISRQNEFDADAYAVTLMREAGLDPEEAARLFDSIGEGLANATHPSPGNRGRAIRALLEKRTQSAFF